MRTCKKCGTALPESSFGFSTVAGRRYPRGTCKTCLNARAKQLGAERTAAPDAKPTAPLPPVAMPAAPPPTPEELVAAANKKHEERSAVSDMRKEHSALVQENRRQAALIHEIGKLGRSPNILVYDKPSWERSDAIACAVGSDWHVEEPVEAASVHGLNEYNLDIARSRARHFFLNLLKLTDMMGRESVIKSIHLSLLGDFFSGWIHEELIANGLLAPGDAALFVKGLLCSGIDFLLKESSYIIEGDCLAGNHGRMTKQMHFGDPTGTSLETVMYHHVVDRYHGNPRVRINVASQAMVYRQFFEKFNLRLIHGYEVKYGGGVGGLTIPLRKSLAQWNNPIRADLTVLGHFHQLFDGGDFLVNGSLIGYNLFAQAIKASYEEARQAFFLIDARGGGQKSVTAPIWLDDAHKKPEPLIVLG